MTVEEAIEKLKGLAMSITSSTREEALALSMAISALEKEKEPQPEQADKDSSKNNSIYNDNTKLKICQEVIDNQIGELVDYYHNQLSDYEKNIFNKGKKYRELLFVKNSLEEKINET